MSSKQRNKLLLKHKYEIINKIENNVKRSEIIKEYKLKSDSNNCKILKSKAKIIANYEKFNPKASKSTSYIRSSNYPDVEEAIETWIRQMRDQKISLSSLVI